MSILPDSKLCLAGDRTIIQTIKIDIITAITYNLGIILYPKPRISHPPTLAQPLANLDAPRYSKYPPPKPTHPARRTRGSDVVGVGKTNSPLVQQTLYDMSTSAKLYSPISADL